MSLRTGKSLRLNVILSVALLATDFAMVLIWLDNKERMSNIYVDASSEEVVPSHSFALKYGDEVPPCGSIQMQEFIDKGKLLKVILFIDPTNPSQRDVLMYADILAKEFDDKVDIIAVSLGDRTWLESYGITTTNIPVVSDTNFKIRSDFKLWQDASGTILVDVQKKKIAFAAPGVLPNLLLKQLLVRQVDGRLGG